MSGDEENNDNTKKEPEIIEAEVVKEGASVFDELGAEHKQVLHELIGRGFGGRRCRKLMMEQFKDEPSVLPIVSSHVSTYNRYIASHRDSIEKALVSQRELTSDMQDSVKDMELLTKMDSIPMSDTKAVLDNLYKRCNQQIKLITLKQNNYADPLWGKLLLEMMKTQKELAVCALELRNEMEKDLDTRILGELETFMTMILSSCVEAFRKHGDKEKFSEFESELIDKLQSQLKNYIDARQKQITKHKGV